MPSTRTIAVLGVAGLALGALALPTAASAAPTGLIRVDQVGYLQGDTKQAYLMVQSPVSNVAFKVVDAAGHTVLSGKVSGTSRGAWNTKYKAVYPITFTDLHATGTYHITVSGGAAGTSPDFRVARPGALYSKAIADGIAFYQVQRDGPNVIAGQTDRKPSHLNDAKASVYATPNFEPDSDVITDAALTKVGGPVNVMGGWFDAGDYLKFTHTTAFGDAILFATERALGDDAPSTLDAEAHFGEKWLDQMWDATHKTLYLQVGIGSGNSAGTFNGDHDIWRLPQVDDADSDPADALAAAHRPVFLAADPGKKISPNLVGRVSAAFALGAQVDAAAGRIDKALSEYGQATTLYAMAATASPPDPLTTALPNAFYPEDTWRDDMEFGATELALASQALGRNASGYLADAAGFAKGYIANDTGDTFNLYDTSALAHADLIRALAKAGNPSVGISRAALVADLKRQVKTGADRAAKDVFHAGGIYDDFDVDSHTFGMLTTQALYRSVSGDDSFDNFATQQRDWLFGSNAWGVSFMVGEGSNFPQCMQHQVDNIAPGRAIGAVVNGPNNVSNFEGGLGDFQDGMVKCPANQADPYNQFSTKTSRFVDDVRSWQTDEPALDMTGSAILGLALQRELCR